MKTKLFALAVLLASPAVVHAFDSSDFFRLFMSRAAFHPASQPGWQTPPPITVQTPAGSLSVPVLQRYASWPVPPLVVKPANLEADRVVVALRVLQRDFKQTERAR